MRDVERFAALLCVSNIEEWRKQIFQIANDSGFQQTRVAILPDPKAPIEAEHAFQHSNYSHDWLDKYASDKMHYFDPTFSHCLCKSTPQIWSPELFSSGKQLAMYEEACGYRIRSGDVREFRVKEDVDRFHLYSLHRIFPCKVHAACINQCMMLTSFVGLPVIHLTNPETM